MNKLENQGKMLSELYSKSQILAIALFFFRRIDDIDFMVLENILRRKLGLTVGVPAIDKPLHESIEDLSDHIVTKEITDDGNETIHVYSSPIMDGKPRIPETVEEVFGCMGEIITKDLYLVMKEIYEDSLEMTLRKISLEPRFSMLTSSTQVQDIRDAARDGLLINDEYSFTEDGLKQLIKGCISIEEKKAVEDFNINKKGSNELDRLRRRGLINPSKLALTKLGRVFLLASDNEYEMNYMRNLLFGEGVEGRYMNEYLVHIYDLEIQGFDNRLPEPIQSEKTFCTFSSKLRAVDYLEYCKEMGYDDSITTPVSDSKDHGAKTYPDKN